MKNSRFSEPQIIKIAKEADVGMKVQDLCRQCRQVDTISQAYFANH